MIFIFLVDYGHDRIFSVPMSTETVLVKRRATNAAFLTVTTTPAVYYTQNFFRLFHFLIYYIDLIIAHPNTGIIITIITNATTKPYMKGNDWCGALCNDSNHLCNLPLDLKIHFP